MNNKVFIKQIYVRCRALLSIYGRFFTRVLIGRYKKQSKRSYPTTLQLPITYMCNFDCVMCGMRQLIKKPGFSTNELEVILSDPLFSRISSVGVNGGEPFLLCNIQEYISIILKKLPSVKNLYIISNGYLTDRIAERSQEILSLCHQYGVKYHLSVSIDGFGSMHDKMRGKEGAFIRVAKTCETILAKKEKYCDTFGAICTVTKINVDFLSEIDTWAKLHNVPIGYNIATIHERIQNTGKYNDFSVFTDEHARMMAEEYFFSKFLESSSELYYSLFYYTHTRKRISSCDHKTNTVTLTPDGSLSYCATHSDEIGNVYSCSAEKLFFSKNNMAYRDRLHQEYCDGCSHYSGPIDFKYYLTTYAKERLRRTQVFK